MRPKNGLTPTAYTVDEVAEWVNPYPGLVPFVHTHTASNDRWVPFTVK